MGADTIDVTKLTQRPDVARQKLDEEARARVRARGKTKKVYVEPPRSQAKGPIAKGPRAYVECPMCTTLFDRPTGIPKQHARAHIRAHRLGQVRRPTEVTVSSR